MANIEPQHYDLCVIGCGPGGFAAAMRALDLGKHVLQDFVTRHQVEARQPLL